MTEAATLGQPGAGEAADPQVSGRSPWALALRRLTRNRVALAALVLFLVIVAVSFAAPLYADHVAHTNPFVNNLNGTTIVNGKETPLMQEGGGVLHLGVTPIGPTWDVHHYFLGADTQGRDVAARVLYGGRSSLQIGIGSALLACLIATVIALFAGFYGGVVDSLVSRLMDVIWAFPVILLAVSISTVLLNAPNGLRLGPLHVVASSLWLPTMIIAFIYVPYVYRPVRGHVLSVTEKEFVEAAVAQGASNLRLIFSEILPNVVSVVIVLLPLMIATTILTESALSFLTIGVQPPNASWGTVIQNGQQLLYTRPWVAIAPGIMIVLTVLSLNVLGDGIRDALDPRAKLRVER
ncbi:MAG: peptide/nickel transport system permease protein [Gaiellales bacterium]|nr:peptide/nickel transport system permease protein [Gaiellales bacterium]